MFDPSPVNYSQRNVARSCTDVVRRCDAALLAVDEGVAGVEEIAGEAGTRTATETVVSETTVAVRSVPRWTIEDVLTDPSVDINAVGSRRQYSLGERKLAKTLLEDAMHEAALPPCSMRDDARAWLRDTFISAKDCFESLDINYNAAMQALEKRWTALDAMTPTQRRKFGTTRRRRKTMAI